MKILITTGIYPPDIGGPAQYAKNLVDEFERLGYEVSVAHYTIEKRLPTGVRHLFFSLKAFKELISSRVAIAMDTFSVGVPTILVAKILRRRVIIRIAGDFLWETYVERTGDLITLKDFYTNPPHLSLRDRIVFFLTAKMLPRANALVFSTEWQREIFIKAYRLSREKTHVIGNYFPRQEEGLPPQQKNFVWATRPMKLKNGRRLYRAFAEARRTNEDLILDDGRYPYDVLMERIKSCYAIILPSLSDVSPNLINDAIRYGKPFIMTRESGYTDLLQGVGIFIDPGSEESITKAILELAEPARYEVWKSKVKNFTYTHDYKQMAKEYVQLFK